ncbi:MAG: hypothetical protein JKY88_09295 [Pseudomonadales bacterium]|nr:hypothetical protein [Pseudomonadales bacterium]
MNSHWQTLLSRFDALSLREQMLLGVTIAALTSFGLQLGLVDPTQLKQSGIEKELAASRALTEGFQRQLGKGQNQEEQKKSERLKVEIGLVQAEITELNEEIDRYAETMVPAEEMPSLLQVILEKSDLQLVSLSNIVPIPIMSISKDADEIEKAQLKEIQLYRHGISLKLRGEYRSVLKYISELEMQKWKFNWRSMVYEVDEYPIGEVELQLQTLSRDERWMGV